MLSGNIEAISVRDFERQTGLVVIPRDAEGRVRGGAIVPKITQFLNSENVREDCAKGWAIELALGRRGSLLRLKGA